MMPDPAMSETDAWFRFVLAVLATWRATHLLAKEDGPADLIVRIRVRLGRRWAGALMDCFHCLSLWIAAPAALFVTVKPVGWLLVWLALSGAACLLERLEREPIISEPLSQPSEGESSHVLRPEEISVAEHVNQRAAGWPAPKSGWRPG